MTTLTSAPDNPLPFGGRAIAAARRRPRDQMAARQSVLLDTFDASFRCC